MKIVLLMIGLLTLTACQAETTNAHHTSNQNNQSEAKTMNTQASTQTMQVIINNQTFELALENNKTAQAFAELLPLNLSMQDHLKNEKFAVLSKTLPSNDNKVGQIQVGDVMLYQGDTLVIFYESFSSNYSYTRIGKIVQTDELKAVLGSGNAQVIIQQYFNNDENEQAQTK